MGSKCGETATQLPEKVLRFNWTLIEPGDVICSTIRANPVSMLIRALTSSDFSHVSMCVETKGCVEANESVARFSLLRVGCLDPTNVKVLRLRDDAVPNAQNIRLGAAQEALKFLGQPYWTAGTFRALFRTRPVALQPGAFCSHLVASAYRSAGLEIVSNISPEHVTPRDIAECTLFQDISKAVLEAMSRSEIRSYFEFLDGERASDTPHLLQVALELDVCQDIASDFQRLVMRTPRSLTEAQEIVLRALGSNHSVGTSLDTLLDGSLRKFHFVDELTRVLPHKPLYDPDLLVAWLTSDASTSANVERVLQNCRSADAGSDVLLEERLEMWKMHEKAANCGIQFAGYLATLSKTTYELHKELIIANRLCIQILEAFKDGKDFIQLAPSGDPRTQLTESGHDNRWWPDQDNRWFVVQSAAA